MAKNGIFRNVNILHEFNIGNSNLPVDIYQPGILNPYDVLAGLKYSAFITSLRLTIDITSINELSVIQSDILASDATISDNNKQTFQGNNKKCLTLYMRTSTTPTTKVADIYLFNQRPYYYLDLIPYFTSAATLDLAPDAVLSVQFTDVGYGLLQYNDRVLLLGTSVEEAPQQNQEYLELSL